MDFWVLSRGQRIVDYLLEVTAGPILYSGACDSRSKQRLRSQQDQRPSGAAMSLGPEQVELLGRCGAVGHRHVFLSGQEQEAFQPGRRVLWSLALVAVRKQQD